MRWLPVLLLPFALAGCLDAYTDPPRLPTGLMRPASPAPSRSRVENSGIPPEALRPTRLPADAGLPEKPSPADLSALANEASLRLVLRLTAENNPQIRAARLRWLAAAQRRPQVTALPDPRLQYTHWLQQMSSDFEEWRIGVSQTIPWPEKLLLAGRIADKDTQIAYLKYQVAVRNAMADAKEAYFELYYIERARTVTEAVGRLYQRYAAVAAGGVPAGRTKLPEMFRAESQRAQLGYDSMLLAEMRVAEAERLRAVIGLPAGAEPGPTEDVAEPGPLATALDALHDIALRNNQELAAAGVEIEKAGHEAALARRGTIPDLTVGVDYARTGSPKNPSSPTRDPVTFGIEIAIPLDQRKYTAMAREAARREEAASADRDAMRLQTRSDLARAYFSLNNSARLVRLYRLTLIPQARQALQSAEELHRKGDANLASVLETAATIHNFELARLRATADFHRNVARIERILGSAMETDASPTVPGGREQDRKPANPNDPGNDLP